MTTTSLRLVPAPAPAPAADGGHDTYRKVSDLALANRLTALRAAIAGINARFDARAAQLEQRRTDQHAEQHAALLDSMHGLSAIRSGVEPHLVDVTAARTWLTRNGHPDPGVDAVNIDRLVHLMLCNALARLTNEWRITEVKYRAQLDLSERARRRALGPLCDEICRIEVAHTPKAGRP